MRSPATAARLTVLLAAAASTAVAGCTAAVPAASSGPATSAVHTTSAPAAPASVAAASSTPRRPRPHRSHRSHRLSTRAIAATTAPVSVPTSSSAPAPVESSATPKPPAGDPTVVLNPGHNGGNASHAAEINRQVPAGYGRVKACDTTGTNTDAGYPEHAFTWDVSLRVARILRAHGVRVVLTRHSDTGVGPCVDRRAAIGNHPWVAAVVSIHADGAPASGHGFHVNQDSRRPQGATRRVARESRQLGTAIHATLERSSGLVPSTYIGSDGYYYRDDLAGLDLARRPATFLELGNMRNAHDAALQTSPRGRERIAAAVAAGILAYLAGR